MSETIHVPWNQKKWYKTKGHLQSKYGKIDNETVQKKLLELAKQASQ